MSIRIIIHILRKGYLPYKALHLSSPRNIHTPYIEHPALLKYTFIHII
jgi:hypothetical protein